MLQASSSLLCVFWWCADASTAVARALLKGGPDHIEHHHLLDKEGPELDRHHLLKSQKEGWWELYVCKR